MKLLNKSTAFTIIYAAIILLIAVPVFYFVIQHQVKEDVDESLLMRKNNVTANLQKGNAALYILSGYDPSITLEQLDKYEPLGKFYRTKKYDSISHEKIPYRVLETNIQVNGSAYKLKLYSSLIDSEDLIESLVATMVAVLLLIVIGLVILTRILSKILWKPFYKTVTALDTYRVDSDDKLELVPTSTDEFRDLNKSLTALTGRSRETYLAQKEFTENASHEMQTPLAIFQAKVELLMQTSLNNEQAELTGELYQAAKRLSRLNKTLLLLSKIENKQFPENEDVLVDEVVKRMLHQFDDVIVQRNQVIKVHVEPVLVKGNKTLLETLVANLLSNSIKYSAEAQTITISLKENTLAIANIGDAKLDEAKLFRRFQKQNATPDSTGLGLEIIKKICDVSGYTITYKFENSSHIFSVTFSLLSE